jgi:hypothetical protein
MTMSAQNGMIARAYSRKVTKARIVFQVSSGTSEQTQVVSTPVSFV